MAWWTTLRPSGNDGWISIALTHRSAVRPVSTVDFHHLSWPSAGTVYGSDGTIRSGSPNCSASRQAFGSGHSIGAGASAGLPCGAPASTHPTIVSISSSLSDRSFLNRWIPTVLSMCQGGISLASTFALIDRAHGRASR